MYDNYGKKMGSTKSGKRNGLKTVKYSDRGGRKGEQGKRDMNKKRQSRRYI